MFVGLLLFAIPLLAGMVAVDVAGPAPESIYKDLDIGDEGNFTRDPLFGWSFLVVVIYFVVAPVFGFLLGAFWATIHGFVLHLVKRI